MSEGDYVFSALLKKLLGEAAKHFLEIKHNPTPEELFDETERRGILFCKKEDIEFKDTLAFVQLQRMRELCKPVTK